MSDLVERLKKFDCITMNGCGDDLRKEAADEITALRARLAEAEAAQIMLRAERDGLASLLLSVQQDSIAATKALATARRDALEEAAREIDCGGCYGNPCPRPGDCMQGIANEIRVLIAQED